MQPELFALLSACFFGLGATFTRRGLEHGSVKSGVAVAVCGTALVLFVAGLGFQPIPAMPVQSLGLLALSGLVGSLLGRAAGVAAIAQLGASNAGPLLGTYPLFAFGLGVLLLDESLSALGIAGACLVVAGVGILTGLSQAQPARMVGRQLGRWAVLLPLGAALLHAAADTMIRAAMVEAPYPLFGASVAYVSTLLGMGAALAVSPALRKGVVPPPRALGWFLLAGMIQGLAILMLFVALSLGQVVQVTPIVGATPLFVLVWSLVLLRRLEVLHRSTILGALVVVAGIVLVSLSPGLAA